MTAELRIGTLRLRGRPSDVRRRDARAAVRELDLEASNDRPVLVIRSMQVTARDPVAARQQLAEIRRTAARPALGEVDPHAEAVEFSDEAEALLCLSTDVLRGRAAERWWWSGRLPRQVTTPGDTLASLWIARPRWVPEVLSVWLSSQPQLAVQAVSLIPPAVADAVLDAVLADYIPAAVRRPSTLAAGPGPAWLARAVETAPVTLSPAAAVEVPPAVVQVVRRRLAERLGPLPNARLSGPSYALMAVAVVLAEQPTWATTPEFIAWLDVERTRPPEEAAAFAEVPAPPEPEPEHQAAVTPIRPDRPRSEESERPADERSWQQRPWEGAGPAIETDLATMLYAVNLVRWFDLTRLDECGTGWSVVEAIGRWLLRGLPTFQRRQLLQDPLLPLLAQLDGRPDDVPTPVKLGTAIRPARRFLNTHQLAADVFAQPGTVVVSRTHVDVVLGIDQIHLGARASGLDQDPGWLPELGRVVLFHFEGAA